MRDLHEGRICHVDIMHYFFLLCIFGADVTSHLPEFSSFALGHGDTTLPAEHSPILYICSGRLHITSLGIVLFFLLLSLSSCQSKL